MFKVEIRNCSLILLFGILLLWQGICSAQGLDLKGQISAWGIGIKNPNDWSGTAGIRYIPQFNYSYKLGENDVLNAELLFNTYYENYFPAHNEAFKLYRAILRYSTEQSEVQIGLQKINFGPAQLLRPLMWFDRTDPRDPLKLTDGVYGIRYKLTLLDNTIFWIWCLYGNNDNVGYEILPTLKNNPEFGGRLQLSALGGEIAGTFHTRKADASLYNYRENRYALDGRWDIGIGLWFEAVWQQNISFMPLSKWNKMATIGADYTIPVGNGIYILGEHMFTNSSNSFWSTDPNRQFSAVMAAYTIGSLDNISLQEYYDWHSNNLYQYLQLQRTYDNFMINLALFHYPENGGALFFGNVNSILAGYGIQLMLIYNY